MSDGEAGVKRHGQNGRQCQECQQRDQDPLHVGEQAARNHPPKLISFGWTVFAHIP